MICGRCKKEISDDAAFCEHCGAKITSVKYVYKKEPESIQKVSVEKTETREQNEERSNGPDEENFCIYCGTKLPKGAVFCFKCGKRTINGGNTESKKDDNRAKEGAKSSGSEKTSPKVHAGASVNNVAEKLDTYEPIRKWGFKVCAVIAVIGMFLPVIDYGFYTMNAIDMVEFATMEGETPEIIIMGILVMALHLTLSIFMFAYTDVRDLKVITTIGTILLLCIRILPNLIMGVSISSEMGYGFGYDIVQYGSGWLVMFLPFLVATAAAWFLDMNERKEK